MSNQAFTRRLRLLRRSQRRGFTLIELMVVVVIIAIVATVSVPLFVSKMRERRAQQTALQIAGLYREARMRALGRGAAVLVSYDGTSWQVREGVEGEAASLARNGNTDCKSLPTRGCMTNDWGNDTSRSITTFNPANVSSDISAELADGSDSLELCFTPLGRAFSREDDSTPFAPLTSVVSFHVQRGVDGLRRTVVVLPNGTSRLGL